jgi:hypothetical protein
MSREEEKSSYKDSVKSIEKAMAKRPVGFNAFWMGSTPSTLEILQELGFIYHIDDLSGVTMGT